MTSLAAPLAEAPALLAAAAVGAFVAALAALLVRPTRRLAGRVRPYTTAARITLGGVPDALAVGASGPPLTPGVVRRLFGPPVAVLARSLGNVLDLGSDESLRLRLRHAGIAASADEFRVRQLGAAVLGGALATAVAVTVEAPPAAVLVFGILGIVAGAGRGRGRLDRAVATRRERMRAELYTVNHLLAVHLRTGGGPMQAVQRLVTRGRGLVVDELAEALRLVAGGVRPADAFSRLAQVTAEPQAARTYELLATGVERGADLAGAMLALSDDLRDRRREDLRRSAVRRRGAMLIPIVFVLAPVMLIFLILPLLDLFVLPQ